MRGRLNQGRELIAAAVGDRKIATAEPSVGGKCALFSFGNPEIEIWTEPVPPQPSIGSHDLNETVGAPRNPSGGSRYCPG